jgi:hypothetical protein
MTRKDVIAENNVPETPIEKSEVIDDYAMEIFENMGYSSPLSNSLIAIYTAFKRDKDKIQPGRLSLEGFACVATIAKMYDHFSKSGEKDK